MIAPSVLLLPQYPPKELAELARLAEALGYEYLWYADERFHREVYSGLTLCALQTERIKLGPCVTDPYTRHPALTAMAMVTLDELTGGRAVLGYGTGASGFRQLGVKRARPVRALREAIELVRQLWRGEPVDYRGETVSFFNGRLNVKPPSPSLPIVIGTRGRQLFELAGEVADGVLISSIAGEPGLRAALAAVERGARRAGRSLSDLQVMVRLDVCLAADGRAARRAVKPMLAVALASSYPNLTFVESAGLTVPAELREALISHDFGRIVRGAGALPDEFADHLALAGTPEEVADRLRQMAALGITQVTIYPVPVPGQTMGDVLRAFAEVGKG